MGAIYVSSYTKDTSKTGNDFLKITCVTEDKKNQQVYLWDDISRFEELYDSDNRIFDVRLDGNAQFPKITGFDANDTKGINDFIDFIYPNDEFAFSLLKKLISFISDEFLKTLVSAVFEMPAFPDEQGNERLTQDLFCIIPAAKAHHHEGRYGLIRHTHEVMSFVSRVCSADLFNAQLDVSMALSGALLHDVGKIYEYRFDGVNACTYGTGLYDNAIYLSSHLYKGAEMVECAYRSLISNGTFSDDAKNRLKVEHLKHIILAHHLQRDWGAVPKEPKTLEALLVFLGDYFSAAFGKTNNIDWSDLSLSNLYGSTGKGAEFFGISKMLFSLDNLD